jgi:hypothetical protein
MCGVKPPVSDGIFILHGVFFGNPASAMPFEHCDDLELGKWFLQFRSTNRKKSACLLSGAFVVQHSWSCITLECWVLAPEVSEYYIIEWKK